MKVQEKKRKVVVLCSRPRQNVKFGRFMSYSCATMAQKCRKKPDPHAKLLFFQSMHIAFLPLPL